MKFISIMRIVQMNDMYIHKYALLASIVFLAKAIAAFAFEIASGSFINKHTIII